MKYRYTIYCSIWDILLDQRRAKVVFGKFELCKLFVDVSTAVNFAWYHMIVQCACTLWMSWLFQFFFDQDSGSSMTLIYSHHEPVQKSIS